MSLKKRRSDERACLAAGRGNVATVMSGPPRDHQVEPAESYCGGEQERGGVADHFIQRDAVGVAATPPQRTRDPVAANPGCHNPGCHDATASSLRGGSRLRIMRRPARFARAAGASILPNSTSNGSAM